LIGSLAMRSTTMSNPVTATIYVERPVPVTSEEADDWEELEIEVSGGAVPFVRGRTYGPPERCYPDEGGYVEDVEATFKGQPFELTEKEEEKAQEALQEAAADAAEAAADAWAEARAEARAEALEERDYYPDGDY
jgi:flagellar biosynthesis/type III secretory pathway protein FliH